jgi:hypothetical protein
MFRLWRVEEIANDIRLNGLTSIDSSDFDQILHLLIPLLLIEGAQYTIVSDTFKTILALFAPIMMSFSNPFAVLIGTYLQRIRVKLVALPRLRCYHVYQIFVRTMMLMIHILLLLKRLHVERFFYIR